MELLRHGQYMLPCSEKRAQVTKLKFLRYWYQNDQLIELFKNLTSYVQAMGAKQANIRDCFTTLVNLRNGTRAYLHIGICKSMENYKMIRGACAG